MVGIAGIRGSTPYDLISRQQALVRLLFVAWSLLTTPEVENLTLGDPCVTRIGGCDSFDATTFTQQVFAESVEMPLTPLGEPKILTALKMNFFFRPLGRGAPIQCWTKLPRPRKLDSVFGNLNL